MKKLLTYLTVLALCVTMASAAFSDVPKGMWYTNAVNKVTAQGIMSGTSDTTFEPAGVVSRGTVVTVLWRMEHAPAAKKSAPYPDLDSDIWYADAAAWATEAGIATGYADGSFRGGDPVSREQLALFLYRYSKLKNLELAQGVLTGYRDAGKISSWALDGMKHAVGAGLMTGSGGKLNPKGSAQRAELAVMLVRFLTPAAG
ncbi:MAG: S-layer homology domain-containing protein [Oscillospiraceae bacterium]